MTTLLEPPTILAAGKPPRPFEEIPGSPAQPGEHDAAQDEEEEEV
ncbi:MAG TPA: hypothetical protein VGC72_01050 [Candidatus Elarobacter sp.]